MIARYFQELFPKGEIQDEKAGFFFFTEKKWIKDWKHKGRTAENVSKMIQVICQLGYLTIVHEDSVNESEIRRNFWTNQWFV